MDTGQSLADQLALAAEQRRLTAERVRTRTWDLGANDLPALASYLYALGDHGYQVASSALTTAEDAEQNHQLRNAGQEVSVQADLGHLTSLFDVCIAFAGNAERELQGG